MNVLKKVCSKCHKIGHVNKNYRTQAPIPNNEHKKGKGKVDAEQTKKEMNQTLKKKVETRGSGTNKVKVTLYISS